MLASPFWLSADMPHYIYTLQIQATYTTPQIYTPQINTPSLHIRNRNTICIHTSHKHDHAITHHTTYTYTPHIDTLTSYAHPMMTQSQIYLDQEYSDIDNTPEHILSKHHIYIYIYITHSHRQQKKLYTQYMQ
jgi:hypothetical protein